MFDENDTRAKIVRTALRLAEKRGWRKLTLAEIAREAEVPLAGIRREFTSKDAILRAFIEEADREVLERAGTPDLDTPARDRIFEVIMTRFEVLAPYKKALEEIYTECRAVPDASALSLMRASMRSHYWMLTAAGIRADGPFGAIRTGGLAGVYAAVMPVWLREDDPDLPKTMAALDRRLRRGERWLIRLDSAACGAARFACAFVPRRREPVRRDSGETTGTANGPAAEPSAG